MRKVPAMGQVISFINMKGGVGKTTLVVNVAYALAYEHDKKVLLVDVDPQFNASTYLMKEKQYVKHMNSDTKHTIVDIFKPKYADRFSTVTGKKGKKKKHKASLSHYIFTVYENDGRLDLIPSELNLMIIQASERMTENKLRNFLIEKATQYDYILIDCPPTISIFTQAAILASDKYLVPIKPDPLSTIGLPLLEAWLEDFTDNAGITVACVGIVFCFVRSRTLQMQAVMEDLRKQRPDEVFDSHLGLSVRVSESVERHLPVFRYVPRLKWAGQILDITEEFLNRTSGD